MTGIEIAALVEEGVSLIVKIAGLIQAAQKGDLTAAEELKTRLEHDAAMKEAVDEVHAYGDKLFDTGGE